MPRLSSLTRYPPPRRRTYKKGPDGQHVWPSQLEGYFARSYDDCMHERANSSTRAQNSYIARRFEFYTGLHRTREQVSSHLQQLRKWSIRDYGCRDGWVQAFQRRTTAVPTPVPSMSISPVSSTSQLPSPLGIYTNIVSTYSPVSSSPLLVQNPTPFPLDSMPRHLAPVAQYDFLGSSHTMGLGLSGHWDLQGPQTAAHILPGLPSAEPEYPVDASYLPFLRFPDVPTNHFF